MTKKNIAILTVVFSLLIDQASKIWVKLSMTLGESIPYIGDWARIQFVENEGMAFGMSFGVGLGKFLLTMFRIVAVFFITYYLAKIVKEKNSSKGFVFALALILAGAVGNIIDSIFYGKIFTDSLGRVATLFPQQGYAGWFHGKVVDMLYFPILQPGVIKWPSWIPGVGGQWIEFFPFIFNVSDACITVGVILILLFQKRFLQENNTQSN